MIFTGGVFSFGIISMISTSLFPFFKHKNETWIYSNKKILNSKNNFNNKQVSLK